MYKTKEEVKNWLKEMGIKNYIINEDLTVDVNGGVDISRLELEEIPIKFGIVNGDFYCDNNALTILKGCPEVTNGNFDCNYNKLTSLKGCSQMIEGDFSCNNNKLISLEGCPKIINGDFYCNNNNLTGLNYFPKEIKGSFVIIHQNKIIKEELANFNCDVKKVSYIYSDFNKEGDKEKFLEKVNFYKSKKENELLKDLNINSNNVKLNKKL